MEQKNYIFITICTHLCIIMYSYARAHTPNRWCIVLAMCSILDRRRRLLFGTFAVNLRVIDFIIITYIMILCTRAVRALHLQAEYIYAKLVR